MMRLAAVAALLLTVCVDGRQLLKQENALLEKSSPGKTLANRPLETDTVFSLGGGQTGDVQITGMLQNFPLDEADMLPINDLLDRPTTSYLDVSWSNWVDQRLEMLDLFQEILATPVRPRCPHFQSTASIMDNGMVSYLASSRFGPAILTTYAQQEGEGESDFDWDDVNIPEGESLGRSYEDASLRDELSADADKAFKLAEMESKMLSQEANLGYFGANMRPSKDQIMYNELDGDAESLQPMILAHPNMLNLLEQRQNSFAVDVSKEEPKLEEEWDHKQVAIFVLLFVGCCYVWTCLIISCMRLKHQASEGSRSSSKAVDELMMPLAPEGVDNEEGIEFASAFVAPGSYYAPHGASFSRTAVPLMTEQSA